MERCQALSNAAAKQSAMEEGAAFTSLGILKEGGGWVMIEKCGRGKAGGERKEEVLTHAVSAAIPLHAHFKSAQLVGMGATQLLKPTVLQFPPAEPPAGAGFVGVGVGVGVTAPAPPPPAGAPFRQEEVYSAMTVASRVFAGQ